MKRTALFIALALGLNTYAQEFTKADSLRGMMRLERACFDVNYYHINIDFDLDQRSLDGYVDMHFEVKKPSRTIQVDLYRNMQLDAVKWGNMDLKYRRIEDAVFVDFPSHLRVGSTQMIRMHYKGNPTVAKNAPWDGGFVFKKDKAGKHFVGVACEGDGASLWWPNKDHLSDEPDSLRLTGTVPADLMLVANGNLEEEVLMGDRKQFTWKVSYPINNYNVSVNIADYAHFSDKYKSSDGDVLAIDYYVLKENLAKAKEQFKQVKPMLNIFEAYFGKYPFWNDGFALVETPYLGMEHQSAIAYGNGYLPGYRGMHPPEMDFDYIIIHETGHEYWGNHVSMKDISDMWIHESFCTYSEAVFVEAKYGPDKVDDYLNYQKAFISNASPIKGVEGMNHHGNSTDMYYKGSWMLHSLRNTIANDKLWWNCLRDVQKTFGMKTIDGDQLIKYISNYFDKNLEPIFNQYLKHTDIPSLEYKLNKSWGKTTLVYRWNCSESDFNMPMDLLVGGEEIRIYPTNFWQEIEFKKTKPADFEFLINKFLFKLSPVE